MAVKASKCSSFISITEPSLESIFLTSSDMEKFDVMAMALSPVPMPTVGIPLMRFVFSPISA